MLATPGEQCSYADFYEWQPRIGRPFTWPLFAAPDDAHLPQLQLHEEGAAARRDVWPQVTPRPLTMQFTLATPFSLNVGEVFGELMKVSRAVRIAAYRDPAWRALAAADLRARADEAALGDLRGLRVRALPRAARAGGSPTSRASAAAARST